MSDDGGEGPRDLVPLGEVANKLMTWLTHVYDRVTAGGLGVPDIEASFPRTESRTSREKAISDLVKWSMMEAGSVGFFTNIGGLITLPISLPAGLAGTLAIQMRMVAGIAHLRGYSIRDQATRTTVLLCLIGAGAADAVKMAGVAVAGKLAADAVARLPGAALIKINQAIGIRLLTKAGTTGVINLTRLIPLAGGVIAGTIDVVATQGVATAAKTMLPDISASPTEPEPGVEQ